MFTARYALSHIKQRGFVFKRLSLFYLPLLHKIKHLFVESQVNVCLDVTANIWLFYIPLFSTLRKSDLRLKYFFNVFLKIRPTNRHFYSLQH